MGMAQGKATEGREVALFPTKAWVFGPLQTIGTDLARINSSLLKLANKIGTNNTNYTTKGCRTIANAADIDELSKPWEEILTVIKKVCAINSIDDSSLYIESWIEIMGAWSSSRPHSHWPHVLNGMVFLHLPEGCEDLQLKDPRAGKVNNHYGICSDIPLRATEGMGIIMPAWLETYIEPSKNNSGRMTLKFAISRLEDAQKAEA